MQFITNQYVYFRFSEEAGIPYETKAFRNNCVTSIIQDDFKQRRDEVQARTAQLLSATYFVGMFLGAISSTYFGHVFEHRGRRLAIGTVLLGECLHHSVVLLVILFKLPVQLVLLAYIAYGSIGGGLISFSMQISVCFTDLTRISEKQLSNDIVSSSDASLERFRALYLGIFDGVIIISMAISSATMGALIDQLGFVLPSLLLFGLFGTGIVVLYFLPETNCAPVGNIQTITEADELNSNRNISRILYHIRTGLHTFCHFFGNRNAITCLTLIVLFFESMTIYSTSQFLFLYLMSKPFCWSVKYVGFYSAFGTLTLGVVSILFTFLNVYFMKTVRMNLSTISCNSSDEIVLNVERKRQLWKARRRMCVYLTVAILAIIINKLMMGFAYIFPSPWHTVTVLLALLVMLVRGAFIPILKSFLSTMHAHNWQGRLFSMIALAEYLGNIIGGASFPFIYAGTVAVFSGAVFFVAAGILSIALILMFFVLHLLSKKVNILGRGPLVEVD